MEKGNSFFDDGQIGHKSSNRLVFVIGNIWLMAFTTYIGITQIMKNSLDLVGLSLFFISIAGVLYTGKLVQKDQEIKGEIKKDENNIAQG